MKIQIDTKKLTDSPYSASNDYPFVFDQILINDLIQDIKMGHPTCYLVSGYRGAGKSSFIKKVEHTIQVEKDIIFVHSSFAKYKSHTYLLRKLIRGLYQTFIKEENRKSFDLLKKKETEKKEAEDKKISTLLIRLYEKTFNDVTDRSTVKLANEKVTKREVDILLLIGFSTAFLLSVSNLILKWVDNSSLISLITIVASSLGVIKKFFSLKASSTDTTVLANEFERKSLYDDEISDYHFNNLLEELSQKGFKIVFVLDELDKVKQSEINDLINEMKPFLVSGLANFIVVAGQELFYQFKSSDDIDDAILSTLFSRIIHVPLLSVSEFSNIFNKLFIQQTNFSQGESAIVQAFIDFLVFKSKRIPRKFINLIRQKIYWENDKAYLDISEDPEKYKVYSEMIKGIQKIDDEEIAVNFSDGSRDYLNMQLYIKAEKILGMGWKDCVFTKKNLVNENKV